MGSAELDVGSVSGQLSFRLAHVGHLVHVNRWVILFALSQEQVAHPTGLTATCIAIAMKVASAHLWNICIV